MASLSPPGEVSVSDESKPKSPSVKSEDSGTEPSDSGSDSEGVETGPVVSLSPEPAGTTEAKSNKPNPASESDSGGVMVEALQNETDQLRSMLKEQRKAIVELAEAIEGLSKNQASLADVPEQATVELNESALGEIYKPTDYEKINE